MLTHIWWHLALFYLSQGRESEALELYDEHCWGIAKDYSQDQIGAVSLLARFEIAGIDVGSRWQDLARSSRSRARSDTVQPFLTLQYLYGLARAGRPEAEALLESVREPCRARAAVQHARYGGKLRCRAARACMPTRAATTSAPGIDLAAAVPRMARGRRQPCAARSVRANPAGCRVQERATRPRRSKCWSCGAAPIPTACRSTTALAAVYARDLASTLWPIRRAAAPR